MASARPLAFLLSLVVLLSTAAAQGSSGTASPPPPALYSLITFFGNGNNFSVANASYILSTLAPYTKGSYDASSAAANAYIGSGNGYGVMSIR